MTKTSKTPRSTKNQKQTKITPQQANAVVIHDMIQILRGQAGMKARRVPQTRYEAIKASAFRKNGVGLTKKAYALTAEAAKNCAQFATKSTGARRHHWNQAKRKALTVIELAGRAVAFSKTQAQAKA